MAMSIQTRRRIETNQRAIYASAFHKLQHDLDDVEIGSADMIALLNKAKKEHADHQASPQLVNRFNALADRIDNADNREAVRVIFQWAN